MPCRDLVTVISTRDLLCCNAEYALFLQQQVQQALSLANIDKFSFMCYMTVCLQALPQQANMTEASVPL